MTPVTLEIAANSLASALAAQEGGADRVELCENLGEGGCTPSYGTLAMARERLRIPLYVLIRPRAGDFRFDALERDTMLRDIELCVRLGEFLRAANQQQLEWPLAKDRRSHVHRQIDAYELPVNHVTRRVGSPHTLVLTKTRALFTRDAAEREARARDLAWLRENAKVFTVATARRRSKRGRA